MAADRPRRPKRDEPPAVLHVSARELLEAVPNAVVGADGEGRIAFVNLQAERMFGYEATEMVGKRVEVLLPRRLETVHAEHRASYHANPATRPMGAGLDLVARRKDGSEFPVEISLSPLETLEGVQVVSTIRDVTSRKEIERERERLLGFAERSRAEAEEALRAREEAERTKDDLTNMVVHDLKNPVNGIAMLVQLLLRRGQLSDAQQNGLRQIERTCRESMRLIENILEIAKIEAGRMPVAIQPIPLTGLTEEVAAEYRPIAQGLGRRLIVAVGPDIPPAVADRALLKRVLVNLIVNALRHSGSTDVRVDAAPGPARASVTIRVVDYGHGIPERDQALVFEKFRSLRGDPTADTGLGLPFCKLAVERMQGHITLSSGMGTGTAFAVTLPSHERLG
jgi:PAS domain S-box-containing protein